MKKGATYQVYIGYLTPKLYSISNTAEIAPLTYNWFIQPALFDENYYKYKYFDTADKNIKDCKIFRPFSLFKGNGFEFERFIPHKSKGNVSLRLHENNKKIQFIFTCSNYEFWDVINCIYRDLNNLFVKDRKEIKWYATSANLFLEATHYATTRKKKLMLMIFFFFEFL